MSAVPDCLRDAYVRDVIDLDTFERFVTYFVEDVPCALPQEVITFARQSSLVTDEPGRIHTYFPFGG